jgi:hypothetical protein
MFDSKHYVPILKWKYAEQNALAGLVDEYKDQISPLIELVMPKPKSLFKDKEKKIRKTREELFQELITEFITKRIPKIPKEIAEYWGTRLAFIDFSLLYTVELKAESIGKILEEAAKQGVILIPILNLSDSEKIKTEIRQALKKYKRGVCLRIVSSDLENTNKLNNELDVVLKYLDTSCGNIDLVVDIKEKGECYFKYFNLSQDIKDLTKYRNFIFACGTFPEDLSECTVDEEKLIPRIEWLSWLNMRNKQTKRVPTFADYTIRNPIYNETLQFYHPTSSIKYALEDNWLILKGKIKRFELYLASAALLVKDGRFGGGKFSNGDKFIAEKAKHFETYIKNPGVKGTGNTPQWLDAFINHHLTLTAHQIAKLP